MFDALVDIAAALLGMFPVLVDMLALCKLLIGN